MTKQLILILGDQLSPDISSLIGVDPAASVEQQDVLTQMMKEMN